MTGASSRPFSFQAKLDHFRIRNGLDVGSSHSAWIRSMRRHMSDVSGNASPNCSDLQKLDTHEHRRSDLTA